MSIRPRHNAYWTPWEDWVLIAWDAPLPELARLLQRSRSAILSRRQRLRAMGTFRLRRPS